MLWRAFQAEALAVIQHQQGATVPRTPASSADLIHLRDLGLAVAQLADQQLALEQQVHTRLDRAALVIKDIERRLGQVEVVFLRPNLRPGSAQICAHLTLKPLT